MTPTTTPAAETAAIPSIALQPASGAVQRAILSLQASRAALRHELLPPPDRHPPERRSVRGMARLWWRRLRRWPAARLAGEVVQQWWRRHPWQPLGDTLIHEARSQFSPMVHRHPVASVAIAAAAGALVVASRPWRWAWLDRHLRRAPGTVSGWLVRQLRSVPVQTALAGLVAMAARNLHSAGTDRADRPATGAPEPGHPADGPAFDGPTASGNPSGPPATSGPAPSHAADASRAA